MLGPGEPQLRHDQALDVLREAMLCTVRAVGHITRLLGVGVIHIPVIDLGELDTCSSAENPLDDLVHRDCSLASPIGHGRDLEGDHAAAIELLVVADRVIALRCVRHGPHLERLHFAWVPSTPRAMRSRVRC